MRQFHRLFKYCLRKSCLGLRCMTDFNEAKNSIDKTFIILDFLAKDNKPKSLKEIADGLNAPKSTLCGFLSKLQKQNAIVQDAYTGKYCMGIHMLELGNSYITSLDIITTAKPIMKEVADKCRKSVHLFMPDGMQSMLIAAEEPTNMQLKIVMTVGTRTAMYSNAAGRVFLADMTNSSIRKYIENVTFKTYTRFSVSSEEQFMKMINKTRKNGYGEDHNERNIGMHAIAFPIKNVRGEIRFALSVMGLCNKKSDNDIPLMIKECRKAAAILSAHMGYTETPNPAAK